ncbi:uncharacterized protein EAF01_009348 [Botrytis porri]|uniref:Uncharacterized protein n=1 Tax=Botrytis porri TaxID=87229 RepID=A0A4Z1KSX6_9HELO|nr:uncharacterized protein EAF01_009348 [Botrytis porri]KAF7896945.1 hypothetical protein EAF01_009348 [Botrytis porri]TGO86535.1 hypothetical protein BPOR_0295g00080 [Botrytis porri]
MASKYSGHRSDLRRYQASTHGVKHQHSSSQSTDHCPNNTVRQTPHHIHTTASNTQVHPQILSQETLDQHTIHQAQLTQNPYHTHVVLQNEIRSLQNGFSSLGVDVPFDLYQKEIGVYHAYNDGIESPPRQYFTADNPYNSQSQLYTPDPISTQPHPLSHGYSIQYLAPASTASHTIQPTRGDCTWSEISHEYDSNEQDVMGSSNELYGTGAQFQVFSHDIQQYLASVSQLEIDTMLGS